MDDRVTSATGGPTNALQNLTFGWNKVGSLAQRQKLVNGSVALTEIFNYDALDRLTGSTLNGVANFSASYDAIGNMASFQRSVVKALDIEKFLGVTVVSESRHTTGAKVVPDTEELYLASPRFPCATPRLQ